jgi:DNA-directed RNA polymerase I subunit RPA34.5
VATSSGGYPVYFHARAKWENYTSVKKRVPTFFVRMPFCSHPTPAPKPVSRHIVVSTQPSVATPAENWTVVHQNPPRPSYPKDVLKHAFVPYGARSEKTQLEDLSMDVDAIETSADKPAADAAPTPKVKPTKTKESKESKGKKRKVEGDSPKHKKSKKHKA